MTYQLRGKERWKDARLRKDARLQFPAPQLQSPFFGCPFHWPLIGHALVWSQRKPSNCIAHCIVRLLLSCPHTASGRVMRPGQHRAGGISYLELTVTGCFCDTYSKPRQTQAAERGNTEHSYPRIDGRFVHGELRLSRLNKICTLHKIHDINILIHC